MAARRILNREDTKLFIKKVREQDCLWNERSSNYRNDELKRGWWKLVASEMNMTDDEARKEWRNLVGAMKAAQNRRSKLGLADGKPWKFAEDMSFLSTMLPEPTRTAATPRKKLNPKLSDDEKMGNQRYTNSFRSVSSSPFRSVPSSPNRVSSPSNISDTSRVELELIPNGTRSTSLAVSGPEREEPAPKKARADFSEDERLEKKWKEVDNRYNGIKNLGRALKPEAQDKYIEGLLRVYSSFKSGYIKSFE